MLESGSLLLIGGLAVLLLAGALLLARRFSRRLTAPATRTGDKAAAVLEGYRESHPSFYRIMAAYLETHALDELLAKGDVKAAFRLLEMKRADEDSGKMKSASLSLSREFYRDESRVTAAMLTVLRAIYLDENLSADLSPSALRELDELLDSLA